MRGDARNGCAILRHALECRERESLIRIDRGMELLDLDVLVVTMRDVDRAGAEEIRFPPR
jgi:hypothetical protein